VGSQQIKMDELDKNFGGGHFHLTGDGIDREKLVRGEDIEFGIELDEQEAIEEEVQNYFDAETVFKTLSFDCCREEEDDSDKTPFQKMAEDMEDITPTNDGGILKKILHSGVGSIVPPGASVEVHYNAYFEYQDDPFDSTILRNRPEKFKLGSGGHLAGLEVAFSSMKKKEKSRFLIKPQYAYGKMGSPPRIPEDAVVMFEIELRNFVDIAKADEYDSKTMEEKQAMTFDDRLCLVDSLRQKGNDEFNNKSYKRALRTYLGAIDHLEYSRLANEEEERLMEKKCIPLYLNASLAALRDGNWKIAAKFSRKALRYEKKNVKALYRLGKALNKLGEFDSALRNLMEAQELAPSNAEIREELKDLNSNMKYFREMSKNISQKMFNPLGGSQVKQKDSKENNTDLESMIDYIKDRMRDFKLDEEQKVMHIPPSNKPEYLKKIRELAEAERFTIDVQEETGLNCLRKI